MHVLTPSGSHHTVLNSSCVVPESIHTHHTEGHWKFQGEGVSTAKIYKYEDKLEIPDGGVSNEETFHEGGRLLSFWIHTFGKTGEH